MRFERRKKSQKDFFFYTQTKKMYVIEMTMQMCVILHCDQLPHKFAELYTENNEAATQKKSVFARSCEKKKLLFHSLSIYSYCVFFLYVDEAIDYHH
jgi:hypothetical protein